MTDFTSDGAAAGLPNEEVLLVNPREEEVAEIARLEAEIKQEFGPETEDKTEKQPILAHQFEPDVEFKCEICDMQENVHYYGQTPAFAWGVRFLEDTYVLRDPFQPPPYPRNKPKPECFVSLGAKCVDCGRIVCKDAACSFYYTRTFCLHCAAEKMHILPKEAQTKLSKQLAATTK